MSKTPPGRLVHLFSLAIVDQVLLSAVNFFIGFLMIRRTSDVDYGLFVLVQSGIALLIAAQSAWVSGPLSAMAPRKSPGLRNQMIGAIDASQRRTLNRVAIIALVVPALGYFANIWSGLESVVIVFGVFAGWSALQREFLRNVLLIYARPQSMLAADVVYATVLFAGVAIAVHGPEPAVVWAVTSLAVAAGVGAAMARRSIRVDPGWTSGAAGEFWKEMRPLAIWAIVGTLVYWLFSQSYNFILASRVNLTAVADVNAARLILMPAMVLTIGVKGLLGPTAAAWLAESGLNRLLRRLLLFIAVIAVLDAIYFTAAWLCRNWLIGDLMHRVIADRDRLLLLWGALAGIALFREILQTAMFSLHRFKSLAWLTAMAAAVSLTLMWYGIKWWGPAAVLIGQIAGETVNLMGIICLLILALRSGESYSQIGIDPHPKIETPNEI